MRKVVGSLIVFDKRIIKFDEETLGLSMPPVTRGRPLPGVVGLLRFRPEHSSSHLSIVLY